MYAHHAHITNAPNLLIINIEQYSFRPFEFKCETMWVFGVIKHPSDLSDMK